MYQIILVSDVQLRMDIRLICLTDLYSDHYLFRTQIFGIMILTMELSAAKQTDGNCFGLKVEESVNWWNWNGSAHLTYFLCVIRTETDWIDLTNKFMYYCHLRQRNGEQHRWRWTGIANSALSALSARVQLSGDARSCLVQGGHGSTQGFFKQFKEECSHDDFPGQQQQYSTHAA